MEVGILMEQLITFFGLTPPSGYDYLLYDLKGCILIIFITEFFGLLRSFTKNAMNIGGRF